MWPGVNPRLMDHDRARQALEVVQFVIAAIHTVRHGQLLTGDGPHGPNTEQRSEGLGIDVMQQDDERTVRFASPPV